MKPERLHGKKNVNKERRKRARQASLKAHDGNLMVRLVIVALEGESGPHFQMDLCCPKKGEIPRYKRDVGRQRSSFGSCSQWPVLQRSGAPQHSTQSALVWVHCRTSNLRLERADCHIHLIEQDLDSEPGQEIPEKRHLGQGSGTNKTETPNAPGGELHSGHS